MSIAHIQQEWSWCEKCGHCTHIVRLQVPEDVHPLAYFIGAAIALVIKRACQGVSFGNTVAELLTTGGMSFDYAATVPAQVRAVTA